MLAIQSREPHQSIMAHYPGAEYLPERPVSALLVSAAGRPGLHMLCVTAPEMVDREEQFDYFLSLGAPDPVQCRYARERIRVLSLDDASARWLSTKVRDDNQGAADLRLALAEWVRERRAVGEAPILSGFEPSSELEGLADDLGIAIDQASSSAIRLGSKAESRKIFLEQDIPAARATAEQWSADDLVRAMVPLAKTGIRDFVVKLSSSVFGSGLGNCLISLGSAMDMTTITDDKLTAALRDRLISARISPMLADWDGFARVIPQTGVIAEELLLGEVVNSPSFQGCMTFSGPRLLSTHEQVLTNGQTYAGSSFPAVAEYRAMVIDYGLRAGWALHARGVHTGNYGVDFLAVRSGPEWALYGCEVNLRSTGVMHGFGLVTTLLGTMPDETGELRADGDVRVYLASDTLTAPNYQGLRPRDVIKAVQASGLHYDRRRRSGVVMYMLSALAYGKLGCLAVACDLSECRHMIEKLRGVLDNLAAGRQEVIAGQ